MQYNPAKVKRSSGGSSSLLHAPLLFGLFFDPKSGGDTFLRNVGLHDCTILIGPSQCPTKYQKILWVPCCIIVVRVRTGRHGLPCAITECSFRDKINYYTVIS
jgi:hypothetical protein